MCTQKRISFKVNQVCNKTITIPIDYKIAVNRVASWGDTKIGGKNHKKFNPYHPPPKNSTKWTEAITKWRYSARKIINNIEPQYSTW